MFLLFPFVWWLISAPYCIFLTTCPNHLNHICLNSCTTLKLFVVFLFLLFFYHRSCLAVKKGLKRVFFFHHLPSCCGCAVPLPQDLVDYYRQHSLKEGFSSLDTTLQKPYREMTNGPSPTDVTNASGGESFSQSESDTFFRQSHSCKY